MKRKKGIFVAALVIASLLIPLVPVVSCDEEQLKPDLTVIQCTVVPDPIFINWWWLTIKIQNIGTYDADPFYLRAAQLITYTGYPPAESYGVLKEWYFWNGCKINQVKTRLLHFYWDNPDPDYYYSRCEGFVDCYDDIDELDETNNRMLSNIFR